MSLCVIGYLLSKGFVSKAWDMKLPLYYISKIVPFIAGMRATQRFSLMIYFGIMILSSLGLQVILKKPKYKSFYVVITMICCIIYVVEVYPYHFPQNPHQHFSYSKLDRKIAEIQKRDASSPVILYLPIFYFQQSYPVKEATYMLGSTLHWAPILNGFSGELPNGFMENMKILNTFPSDDAIRLLRKMKVNYLALDRRLSSAKRSDILDYISLYRLGDVIRVSGNEHLVKLNL